jgi:hypothetical protein
MREFLAECVHLFRKQPFQMISATLTCLALIKYNIFLLFGTLLEFLPLIFASVAVFLPVNN